MSEESSLAQNLMAKHEVEPTAAVESENGTPAEKPVVAEEKEEKKPFDLRSEDLFPALGSNGPQPTAPAAPLAGAWGGAKVPAAAPAPVPVSPSASTTSTSSSGVRSSVVTELLTLRADQQRPTERQAMSSILLKVKTATNTTIESSTSKATKATTFVIKGRPENVQRAKREIQKELAHKLVKKLPVPASVRASIIGARGATLKPIVEKSGCQIQLPRAEATPTRQESGEASDDEEEECIDVTIEGDAEGIQVAVDEILAIVKARAKATVSKLRNVDAKYYPFINARITKLEAENNEIQVKVPSDASGPITISGERTAVLAAKANIEKLVTEMAATYQSVEVTSVPRIKQKFISPQEVFESTGVVATFPAVDEVEGSVSLFGPPSKLSKASEFLNKKAAELSILLLDISKAHGRALEHARNLALYFDASNKLKAVEKEHGVEVALPTPQSLANADTVVLEIVGKSEESVKKAKAALVAVVNALPPTHVRAVTDIEPFFFSHIAKLKQGIKSEFFVDVVLPRDVHKSQTIILAYEGNPNPDEEDFAPGVAEISATLDSVDHKFDDIREKQKDITSEVLTIPAENHKYITGPNNTTLNAIIKGHSEGAAPHVVVVLGVDKSAYGYSDDLKLTKNSVWIRGTKAEVKRVAKEIEQVVEESKNYETLSKYTTEFTFPTEHVNKLIGRQGANLTKIREEFGVRIEVDEKGAGYVRGIKKNADEAKARILALGRRLADEVVLRLDVPNEHHATLIGSGGKFVKRLEDRYDVRIQFPREQQNNAAEENGNGNKDRDMPRSKDEVVLKGPSRGVAKVKEELLDLLKYEIEHSFSKTIKVPSKALPRIIGKQGERINEIKDNTNTRIDVSHEETDKENGDKEVGITVTGTQKEVNQAISEIQAVAQDVVDTVTEIVEVDPKYHRLLIGPGGSIMRDIVRKATGSDENNQRMIFIPASKSDDPKVRVVGNKKVVAKIIKIINEIVDEQKAKVSVDIPVAVDRHGALIGAGGYVKRELEEEFHISLAIPQQGSGNENITVVGRAEDVEKARSKIEQLTAPQYKVEVVVPRHLHAQLADRGTFVQRLRNEFNVRVDHGKVSLPKTGPVKKAPAEAFGEVLVTDDEKEVASRYKWTVVADEANGSSNGQADGVVPWKLKGEDADCQKAKTAIEQALEQIRKHDSTGYLWLADPGRYRRVIGPQGSRINKIRSESGCTINVPKSGSSKDSEVITIRGSAEQLENAQKMILESVLDKN
ncbi:protein Scp160p [Trichomonascus vanleenenianus]|uniref:Scp160p n=1 Tax=Trichomonascus vanleenenianus TaxID=2268995 RepID=UPI003ECAB8F2